MTNAAHKGGIADCQITSFSELECRGEHRSSVEKLCFSNFPKGNNHIFALRRQILLRQKSADDQWSPLQTTFLTRSNAAHKGGIDFYARTRIVCRDRMHFRACSPFSSDNRNFKDLPSLKLIRRI